MTTVAKEFFRGQKLNAIYMTNGESVTADSNTEIEVVFENGQMAGVPWALVTNPQGQFKWNLALCEGVRLDMTSE